MSKEKTLPDYRAYTVISKGQDKNFWVAIRRCVPAPRWHRH